LRLFVEGEEIELLSGAILGSALRKADAFSKKAAILE